MKSNPYVYPSLPYQDLTQKNVVNNFADAQTVAMDRIVKLVNNANQLYPTPKIVGETAAEKILSIFLDDQFRFGPMEFIADHAEEWIEKFNHFINNNEPLQFTILGFPFKMAVPLKTKRVLPDMGEVLSMGRLRHVAKEIQKIYQPGAVITIFTEGGFGPFAGIPDEDWRGYDAFLRTLNTELGFDDVIQVRMLSEMEDEAQFAELFEKNIQQNEEALKNEEPEFMEKYNGVSEVIFRLVDSTMYSDELLMDVYNMDLGDEELSNDVKAARSDLRQRAKESIVQYFAYLKTRDDLDFLNKTVPNYLALSVSPKPHRLGVIPVSDDVNILPYHGVPVYDVNKEHWDIQYTIDIRRDSTNSYTPVQLEGDTDSAPFYYEK